jgi:hypothetical protein
MSGAGGGGGSEKPSLDDSLSGHMPKDVHNYGSDSPCRTDKRRPDDMEDRFSFGRTPPVLVLVLFTFIMGLAYFDRGVISVCTHQP